VDTQHICQQYFLTYRWIHFIGDFTLLHGLQYNLVIMKKQSFKTLSHCIFNLNYHLILVTKYRKNALPSLC